MVTWEEIVEERDREWDQWARDHFGLDRWEDLEPDDVVNLPGWPR